MTEPKLTQKQFRARHKIEIDDAQQGDGYTTRVVVEAGRVVYHSEATHGADGIFATAPLARSHGDAWVVARYDQLRRLGELREVRSSAMPERLHTSMSLEADHKQAAKTANAAAKRELEYRARIIDEAMHPRVEMRFSASTGTFALRDMVSVSDGTLGPDGQPLDDSRQESLPGIPAPERDDTTRSREIVAWCERKLVMLGDRLGAEDVAQSEVDEINEQIEQIEQQLDSERAKLHPRRDTGS